MLHDKANTQSRIGSRLGQHFEIALGIAARYDWTANNVREDTDSFAGSIIDEVQFWKSYNNGSAITHFVLCLDAKTDDPLGWKAIDRFCPWTHEFDAAAGNNQGPEAIRTQVIGWK